MATEAVITIPHLWREKHVSKSAMQNLHIILMESKLALKYAIFYFLYILQEKVKGMSIEIVKG